MMLQPLSRAGIGLLLALAVANGGFLYLFPSQAEPDYAWAIAPPISAAAIGAGYLGGVVATALSIASGSWRQVRPLVPGLFVLAVALLAATLIHEDKFRWDYAPTWLWTAVYAGVTVGLVVIWRLQGGAAPAGWSSPLRSVPGGLGLGLVAVGVVMFAAPDFLVERWPWDLTPLVCRVLGGWYLLAGVVLLAAAGLAREPGDERIAWATVGSWSALLLVLPALYSESVTSNGWLWLWLALHGAVAALCAAWLVPGRGRS